MAPSCKMLFEHLRIRTMCFKSKKIHSLIIASFVLSFVCTAVAERLPLKIYTSADGLGSSFVNYIASDSRGFMWFCTRDGLSRFDGSRFVTYQIGEKGSSPSVENIYETRDGTYWITTTAGSYRFDPNLPPPNDAAGQRLNAEFVAGLRGPYLEDTSGNLWVGSGGLFRFDQAEGKFKDFPLNLPKVADRTFVVTDIQQANDGSLWLNTTWGLARRLPDARIVYYPHNTLAVTSGNSSLLADKSGRVWLTRSDQILVIKPEPIDAITEEGPIIYRSLALSEIKQLEAGKTVELPKKGGEIFRLESSSFVERVTQKRSLQTSDGVIWLTSENHLLEFSEGVLHVHTEAEGLPNVMTHLAEDTAGNLWIGGHSALVRLDRRGLTTFGQADGANSSRFFAINEDADGTLFVAGRDYSINRFDGQKFQTLRPPLPKAPTVWTSRYAFLASTGDWWILTSEKLYRFSGITDFSQLGTRQPTKTYTTDDGLKSSAMFQIFEDSSGDIWVSTRGTTGSGHGLARLRKGEERFVAFTEAEGMPPNRAPSAFAEDSFGNLWIGFYEGGAARFDGERFTSFTERGQLPNGLLSDLHLDKKGRLWLGSVNGGLIRLDDTSAKTPSFVYMTTADGLTSNNIRTVTEDNLGRIYVGTASGVDRITPDTGRIKHYSVSDGLAGDFVVDSHRDKSGNLWFATDDGVSRLVPLPDEKAPAPRIFIGDLRIAGVKHPISELGSDKVEKGELPYNENNLRIEFFGLDFRAGETLRYQYKLEGADVDWSQPSELRTVNYANLRPASYRFLVRAVNSDGAVSDNPAVLSFQVLAPFWARWWFITIAVLLLATVVVAFYRYRTAKLREINAALSEANRAEENLSRSRAERIVELEKVRTRIATDLHDDIGSSLTQIAILSEVAYEQGKMGNGGAAKPLTKITEVSNELVGTMSDIVWAINPAKDHLSDLSQRMRRFAADVLTARSIKLHFHGNETGDDTIVNTNLRREVFLIFKESINNIVKHAGAKNVWADLSVETGNLKLTIRDDGTGFDPDDKELTETGNGLKSMRRRTIELGGAFEVRSAKGEATTIEVTFPIESISSTRPPERVV
jgi:signal transduction histidine kinase/ligand-binding sensor domain-containing protein